MPDMKHNKRIKVGRVLMAAGALLLAAAAALLLYNRAESAKAADSADASLAAVQSEIETRASSASPSASLAMPAVTIDGVAYIGYLSVPSQGLDLPVISEWDYTALKLAPCRYYGSVVTDDLVICGHNYDCFFGRLKNLQPGDAVTFTTMDGVTVAYEVAEVTTLQPTQISEMVSSGHDLTLYTCTYGGTARVTVRCDRAD